MIQIDIDPKVPTQLIAPRPGPPAQIPFSAELSGEGEAEPNPSGVPTEVPLFVSPPPAPWPRIFPGL